MINVDTFSGPSFSFRNRVYRFIWGFVQASLFSMSPKPFFSFRAFLLRLFGAKIGKKVHVYNTVRVWAPFNLEVGDESGIGENVQLYSQGKIKIGKRVVISQNSTLCTGTHDYRFMGFPLVTKAIFVEDHVWIAEGSFIHPGKTLKEGSIVGARAVVTKTTLPWSIYAGNPAELIKKRPPFYDK